MQVSIRPVNAVFKRDIDISTLRQISMQRLSRRQSVQFSHTWYSPPLGFLHWYHFIIVLHSTKKAASFYLIHVLQRTKESLTRFC